LNLNSGVTKSILNYPSQSTQKPVYHVSAMTFRNNPVLPVSVAGQPVEENHTAWGVSNAAEIVYLLRSAGFPVATAWSPFESANHWYAIALDREWRRKLPNLSAAQLCQATLVTS